MLLIRDEKSKLGPISLCLVYKMRPFLCEERQSTYPLFLLILPSLLTPADSNAVTSLDSDSQSSSLTLDRISQ